MRYSFLLVLAALAIESPAAVGPGDVASRAASQIQVGDFQSAASLLRPYLKTSAGSPDLWNLLGIAESELSHDKEAESAFEMGLRLAPDSVSINENLGFLYFRLQEYAPAAQYLGRAIALGSDKPGVAFSLAASQIRTGHRAEGVASLNRLEVPLARESSYWTERGWVELSDDPAKAAASFDKALALSESDLRALNGAASAAEALHDDEKALSFLVLAMKTSADDLRTLMHFGTVCLRRDLSVDAEHALERAYQLAPLNNLAIFLYARAEIAMQQWQHAHDLFAEFDRRVPRYAPAQYALGWLDLKLNRTAEARQHLDRSVALDPSNADPHYERGKLDLNEGNVTGAEAELRAALDRNPGHAAANLALGDLLLKKGELAEARRHYELALASDPRSGSAHYKLAALLLREGKRDDAEKERILGASLNAEELKANKTVLVLAEPDGRLITGEPSLAKGIH